MCGKVDDIPGWLENIDIFISHSYWEGQQVALLEAMASGCFALSHFWDGAEEILPIEHLYATESQLVEKIEQYCALTQAERRSRQVTMHCIAVEKFDIKRTNREIVNVVEQSLDRRSRR